MIGRSHDLCKNGHGDWGKVKVVARKITQFLDGPESGLLLHELLFHRNEYALNLRLGSSDTYSIVALSVAGLTGRKRRQASDKEVFRPRGKLNS